MPRERLVQALRSRGQSHTRLLPYLTAGLPDVRATGELVRRVDGLGVAAIEIGLPYSDSIADGAVIQSSFHRALELGARVEQVFDSIAEVRREVRCGLVAMVSFSVVHRFGLERFMDTAAAAGFDGVILPDVPVEESAFTRATADRADLCYIGLIAPTTTAARLRQIAVHSSGFLYQIATAGTTGERSALPPSLASKVAELKRVSNLPVCVGFGISTPQQVRAVCRFADGAIVGSAIVRRVLDAMDRGCERSATIDSAARAVAELMDGVAGD